jgi:methylated-DNA-[protein]-cysteine S-methyltransferase
MKMREETMKKNSMFFYDSPLGKILTVENGSALTWLFFTAETGSHDAVLRETALLKKTGRQLREYFAGERKLFDLPLAPSGTPFQLQVWKALQSIPYGQTRSYGQIAQMIGRGKASRAVGRANSKNPISLVIPCHRVIGADGKLVGYGGGLDKKAYLLELEKRNSGAL